MVRNYQQKKMPKMLDIRSPNEKQKDILKAHKTRKTVTMSRRQEPRQTPEINKSSSDDSSSQ
jgi:hypothetical protein